MVAGEKPKACERCWIEEENGYRSHRLTEIDVWRRRLGEGGLLELQNGTSASGEIALNPVALDLRIGNTCNLQCVMCRPHDSIKWLNLANGLAEKAQTPALQSDMVYKKSISLKDYGWQDNSAIWDEMRAIAPTLQELIIGGGEPMLLNGHIEFIEHCVRQGYASRIHLRYHTNLTILNEAHFDLWKHFKVVEFFPSLDGLGEMNHYVRYPADWATIEKNLNLLDAVEFDNIKVMILFSSHLLSLFNLADFLQWIEDRRFKKVTHGFNGYLHPGIVMHPEYLSPQVYPAEIKRVITERLSTFERRSRKPSYKTAGVLEFMNQKDKSELLPSAIEYIQLLDQTRGTSFAKTFPELAELLKNYSLPPL
jgi:hypothetical protein